MKHILQGFHAVDDLLNMTPGDSALILHPITSLLSSVQSAKYQFGSVFSYAKSLQAFGSIFYCANAKSSLINMMHLLYCKVTCTSATSQVKRPNRQPHDAVIVKASSVQF